MVTDGGLVNAQMSVPEHNNAKSAENVALPD